MNFQKIQFYPRDSQNLKLKYGATYSMYKPVLLVLFCCGIAALPESSNRLKLLRRIVTLLNATLTVATVFIGIVLALGIDSLSPSQGLSTFLIMFSGLMFKFTLYRKRRGLHKLIAHLTKRRTRPTAKLESRVRAGRKRVNVALVVSLFSLTFEFFFALHHVTVNLMTASYSYSVFKLLNVTLPEETIVMETKFRFAIQYIHNIYPYYVFILLYTLLAWHLKLIAAQVLEDIRTYPLRQMFETYNNLCRLIQEADKTLRSPILMAILFMSTYLYFVLFFILKQDVDLGVSNFASAYSITFLLVQLSILLYVASGIPDLKEKIHNAVLDLDHDPVPTESKLFLVVKSQQQMGLSLGGFVLIKRGAFLSLLGTLFTYCLLVRSFQN